jgi:hypothetical protein
MTHLRRLSIVALAAALLVVPGGASAQTPTLDQSQSLVSGVQIVTGPDLVYAQTFRAGLSGGLPLVELAVNKQQSSVPDPGPLFVELQSTSAGEPSGQVLATASVPADMVPLERNAPPGFVRFQLQPVVPITAGVLYALTLGAPDSSQMRPSYGWGFSSGDSYPAGESWVGSQLQQGWTGLGTDFAFQTYVNQAGVGAPGPAPDLAQRIAELKALLARLGLPPGLTERLQKLLDRVLAALPPGNSARANRSLRAFGNRVAAQRGKKLTVAQARRLSTATRALRASLALKRLER